MKNKSQKTKQKEYKQEETNYFNKKEGLRIMNRNERKLLYSVIGFLGGILAMTYITPEMPYRNLAIFIGGVVVAFVGYTIATRN